MAFRMAGSYVGACPCRQSCPCAYDAENTAPDGKCHPALVFRLDEGNLGDLDLSGAHFALFIDLRNKISAGNWKVGVVVDEAATQEQAAAIERIVSGQEGGAFGELAALVGEFLGLERAAITFSDGERPKVSVAGMAEMEFQPYVGQDGTPTIVKNAMFGFSPEYQIGRAKGSRSNAFNLSCEFEHGEGGDYEWVA